jgi:hypothetical protein
VAQDKRHPKTTFDAKFPYNRATVTESGHEVHFDDTPGKERIRISHKSGTYIERSADGKEVNMVVGSKFDYIKQGYTQTVDKNVDIKVGGASRTSITGSSHSEVKGDSTSAIEGDVKSIIGGDHVSAVKGDSVHGVTGKMTMKVGGGIQFKGDGPKDIKIDGAANIQFGSTLSIYAKDEIEIKSDTKITLVVGSNKLVLTADHLSAIGQLLYLTAETTLHAFAGDATKVTPEWTTPAVKAPEA